MATMEQVKALMRTHFEGDNERFRTIALQIAAHESKIGHTSGAREIRDIVQNPRYSAKGKLVHFTGKNEMLSQRVNDYAMKDLVLSPALERKVQRVITEYHKKDLLRKNGLRNRSKMLLIGEPGTGKTMTASVFANELCLPLFVIQMEKVLTKYMGETSAKLRQIFDSIESTRGVYLFDEFDAIGSDRSLDNDVGEMRRILNSFLQFLEEEESYSIVLAATNNPQILDKALFRRFDDILEYRIPDDEQILRIIKGKLNGMANKTVLIENVCKAARGLSHAEIARACEETAKYALMNSKEIDSSLLVSYFNDRKELYRLREA